MLVVGDGAVGLCAVIAAKRLGAEQIILMGRHTDRTDLGREFGATDVVAERGEEGVARVRDLTGGDGVDKVIEAVGTRQTLETALGAVIDGGTISRLGVPQYEDGPVGPSMFMRNITLTGGASPARAYIERAAAGRPGRHASPPAASSTRPSPSTRFPTPTGPWPTAASSRPSSPSDPATHAVPPLADPPHHTQRKLPCRPSP